MTTLAEQVLKILRRMEPTKDVRAFRLAAPGMDDAEILARCEELQIELTGDLLVAAA